MKRAPNTSSASNQEPSAEKREAVRLPTALQITRARTSTLLAIGPRRMTGIRWKNFCASAAQDQLSQEQANFYQELSANYATVFPQQQKILDALTSQFSPILAAGPNETGFSAPEESAMRTTAADTTAQAAQQASVALGSKEASMGDSSIPSGASLQLDSGLLNSAAQENAGLQNQITQQNYATGRQNFLNAAGALDNAASLNNPNAYASAATSSGAAANSTMNSIASENSSWMQPVFGMIGGIAGAALGNPSGIP